VAKLALQAGLCYNEAMKLLCSRDAETSLERVTSSVLRRLVTMDMIPQDNTPRKHCSKCKEIKSLDAFYQASRSKDGLTGECKECRQLTWRKWKAANPDKIATYNRVRRECNRAAENRAYRQTEAGRRSMLRGRLKAVYGLSFEEYERLVKQQEGRCAICGKEPSGTGHYDQRLHVDHDHSTGKIRGLLCLQCNIAIGAFDENSDRMLSAIAYLRGGKWIGA